MFLDFDSKSSNYFYILVDGPRTSGDLAEHLRSTSWTTQEPIGNGFMFRHVFKDHVPFTQQVLVRFLNINLLISNRCLKLIPVNQESSVSASLHELLL